LIEIAMTGFKYFIYSISLKDNLGITIAKLRVKEYRVNKIL